MINNYDDYQLDLLVESVLNNETRLILSNRLFSILTTMKQTKNNNIAEHILNSSFDDNFKSKITYIDIDDKGIDMVTFITVPKAASIINSDFPPELKEVEIPDNTYLRNNNPNNDVYKKYRTSSKVGRLITKLFGKIFSDSETESFVNVFKSLRDTSSFEIVEGDDIIHWYLEDNYTPGQGKLNGSCMRYKSAQPYIKFYANNPTKVKLLIIKDQDDDTKIRGRALIWELTEPSGRTFMDRIYTIYDSDIELFKDYAKEKGWLYKKNQNFQERELIVDTLNNTEKYTDLVVEGMDDVIYYPYMDTLKYFDGNSNFLTNQSGLMDEYIKLSQTDGTYEDQYPDDDDDDDDDEDDHEGQIYSEYYGGEWIDEDELYYCDLGDDWRRSNDCFYSEYYGCQIAQDYADDNMTWCEWGEEYRKSEDCTFLDKYQEWAADDYLSGGHCSLIHSEFLGDWLSEDDAVYSEYYEDYLDKDYSIEIFTDENQRNTDWRVKDDGTYYKHTDGESYDNDVKIEVEEEDDIEIEEEIKPKKKKTKLKKNK